MQSDQFMQLLQIINLINHTDTLELIMSIKACQDLTSSGFASDSVSVANMLSDSGLHEQQAPSNKASKSSDVSRLML